MRFHDLRAFLRRRLADDAPPLPGPAVQARMAPLQERRDPALIDPDGKRCRPASVLLLLYPQGDGAATFALTQRPKTMRDHSGQISFPGGRIEDGETAEQAALRETAEEIGVAVPAEHVVGTLSGLFIPPTNFCVTPFVAAQPARPDFRVNTIEVARLIEASVAELVDPARWKVRPWRIRGAEVEVPYFDLGGHVVWGATAMMLAEFAALVREAPGA